MYFLTRSPFDASVQRTILFVASLLPPPLPTARSFAHASRPAPARYPPHLHSFLLSLESDPDRQLACVTLLKSAASLARLNPARDRKVFPRRLLAKLSRRLRSEERPRRRRLRLVLPQPDGAHRQQAKNPPQLLLVQIRERHLLHAVS